MPRPNDRTPRRQPLDLRADLHGHALDHMRDEDRRWFEAHPFAVERRRPPAEHEFCLPGPHGECRPVMPGWRIVSVVVRKVTPGIRARSVIGIPEEVPAA